ncbi:MAG: ABC transporter ATP-binding protein, partial [Planctomycetota bacterium]
VQDEPAPFEVLTVDEHLEFTARLYGLDGDWPARADALLERFVLKERRDALGSELSRGMRQKLSFCCAWLPEPAVILLDEPLSGLDPRGIRAARAAILEERERGAAVVLSSHLLELVQSLADRILILDGGRRVFVGTLDEARAAVAAGEGDTLEDVFFAATGLERRVRRWEGGNRSLLPLSAVSPSRRTRRNSLARSLRVQARGAGPGPSTPRPADRRSPRCSALGWTRSTAIALSILALGVRRTLSVAGTPHVA